MSTTLAAFQLANSAQWDQLFSDETTRRHISLTNLIVAVQKNNKSHPLVLSTNMVVNDGLLDSQCDALLTLIIFQSHFSGGWLASVMS